MTWSLPSGARDCADFSSAIFTSSVSSLAVGCGGSRGRRPPDGVPATGDLTGVVIWVDGQAYSVVGVVRAAAAGLSGTVVIPYAPTLALAGDDRQTHLLVRTEPGGGATVAEVVRLAVRPDDPHQLVTSPVADHVGLRTGVSAAMNRYIAGSGSSSFSSRCC